MYAYPFLLDVTLCCGQVFRWDKKGDWWYGVVRDQVLKVRQIRGKLEYENSGEKFVVHYFSLDVDLKEILDSINKDQHIGKAIEKYLGLRLIRQNPWECIISYICATYKGIPAIKSMLNNMAKKFGKRIALDGCNFYTFPECENLAAASEADLLACGLGYRAKYILETSKKILQSNFNFNDLMKMPYLEARNALMGFPGVGAKVADCVLLFSLGKTEAFPVDVWVKRVMINHYAEELPSQLVKKLSLCQSLSNTEYEKLNLFGRTHFGRYAGYAQEYLYHFERTAI